MKKLARKVLLGLMSPVCLVGYISAYVETYLHLGRKSAFGHLAKLHFDPEAVEKARQEYIARLQARFPGAEIKDCGDGHFVVEMPDEDDPVSKPHVH